MTKERIQLSVDRDVVQKAKGLDMNLSAFFGGILKGYTSAERPSDGLHEGYRSLFDSMLPLQKEFNCSVKIAKGEDTGVFVDDKGKEYKIENPISIFLEPDGLFYINELDYYFKNIKKIAPRHFLKPEKILSNLLDALARSEEANKGKMKEILMARNIIDAISKTLVGKPSSTVSDKGGRIKD